MHFPQLEPCGHDLPRDEFGSASQLLSVLGQGNDPVAVMLTCWELGGAPDQVSHANPGEIMVIQNAGGLVPVVDAKDEGGSLGSIIYGLSFPAVRHLIVCGHTECKTLGVLLPEAMQRTKNPFHERMQGVSIPFQTTYLDRPARDWIGIIVQEAILQQLANLRSHTYIRSLLQQGNLLMHGWIRDDQSSTITPYDPVAGQFCD